jgi:hypothetical protein
MRSPQRLAYRRDWDDLRKQIPYIKVYSPRLFRTALQNGAPNDIIELLLQVGQVPYEIIFFDISRKHPQYIDVFWTMCGSMLNIPRCKRIALGVVKILRDKDIALKQTKGVTLSIYRHHLKLIRKQWESVSRILRVLSRR